MFHKTPIKLLLVFQMVAILFGCVVVDDDPPPRRTTVVRPVPQQEYCYEHVCDGWSSGQQCFVDFDDYCDSLCNEWGCGAEQACDEECGGW